MKSFSITTGQNEEKDAHGVSILDENLMINELLERLLMQDIHHNGLEEITFSQFVNCCDEFYD